MVYIFNEFSKNEPFKLAAQQAEIVSAEARREREAKGDFLEVEHWVSRVESGWEWAEFFFCGYFEAEWSFFPEFVFFFVLLKGFCGLFYIVFFGLLKEIQGF